MARLLEPGVGQAALAAPPPGPSGLAPAGPGEVPRIKREVILTPGADATLGQLVTLYARATGTDVTNSHFVRAVLKALAQALPELEREASRIGPLRRPSNARGRQAEREEYERRLAAALLAGLRAGRPPE